MVLEVYDDRLGEKQTKHTPKMGRLIVNVSGLIG